LREKVPSDGVLGSRFSVAKKYPRTGFSDGVLASRQATAFEGFSRKSHAWVVGNGGKKLREEVPSDGVLL
jgi:hypothetical protein